MALGWEGGLVRLAPLDKGKHLDNACAWLNDPEVTANLLTGDTPLSRLAEEAWFDRMMKGDDRNLAFAIETLDGEHIGSARSGTSFVATARQRRARSSARRSSGARDTAPTRRGSARASRSRCRTSGSCCPRRFPTIR